MNSDPLDGVRAALMRPWATSSDFDLNPDISLPSNRVLRPAAVLVGITTGPDGPRVILTKRASHLRHHPGQISFPGGRQDDTDPDLAATALREAKEEIGLPIADVEMLGALPVHETVTGFSVTPFLARIPSEFAAQPAPDEVAEVFSVPLAYLTDPNSFRVEKRIWRGMWRKYYIVPWGPYYIWGATARILRGLAESVRSCR
ncbi:MAG: CoA pyrophosphatase [Roseinatronobacter sp.]